MLFSLSLVEIISLPRKSIFRGVFLANHLASTENLPKQPRDRTQLKIQKKMALINKQNALRKLTLRERTDRAWFNYLSKPDPARATGPLIEKKNVK